MTKGTITFFDLDHTLIDTDCEWAWVNMLVDKGLAPEGHRARQDDYMRLHALGRTPVKEYVAFLMENFTGRTVEEMARLARENFETRIRDKVFPAALEKIRDIARNGGRPVLLSGSFRPIVTPVAEHLGMGEIVCTELEVADGRYTGELASTFCIREGKLERAQDYCAAHGSSLKEAEFYGDSLSDVAMFRKVGRANAVNPGPELEKMALDNGWRIVRWGLS